MERPGAVTHREGVDVANGTTVTCPVCGTRFSIGITFEQVTIVGAGMNVAVDCPRCGETFDATGGGDGTFSTVGGELRRVTEAARSVRNALAHADPAELAALRRALDEARQKPDIEQAVREQLPAFPAFEEWAKRNPALMKVLLGAIPVLLLILSMLHQESTPPAAPDQPSIIVVRQPDDEEIEQVVRDVLAGRLPADPTGFPPTDDPTGLDSGNPGDGHGEVDGDVTELGEKGEDSRND